MRSALQVVGCTLAALIGAACSQARAEPVGSAAGGSVQSSTRPRPLNVILILRDQTRYELPAAPGYDMPALDRLARQGTSFRNHYIASAMCTPSRAALFTGTPPQVNGVFDQRELPYVPSMPRDQPNMGSLMKKLGYRTAFYGKWEMDKKLFHAPATANTTDALQSYGFDMYQPDGDKTGEPDQGYKTDTFTAAESVRWLRGNVPELRETEQPFFMVVSFVNPHDIMYADANVPGEARVQEASAQGVITTPPDNSLYGAQWNSALSPTLHESLSAPGMPAALTEYHDGWSGALGTIPVDRPDMWQVFNDYYLNLIQDADNDLQQLWEGMDQLDLWKNTVVIFTADHGEMAGDHGGLRGKGPMAYEGNSHVPLIIAHPDHPGGTSSAVLTSHLDLLPTLPGLARVPEAQRREAIKNLPGHDFSGVLAAPETTSPNALRPGVLFNYVGLQTLDSGYLYRVLTEGFKGTQEPPATELRDDLDNRGFMSFVFDGRYKFARYYAPNNFNTPVTLEEILRDNDIQLFDLKNDPTETRNLALHPEENKALILRMNSLLNELMVKEVGENDGAFLPAAVRPKQ